MKTASVDNLEYVYRAAIKLITDLSIENLQSRSSFYKIFSPNLMGYGTGKDEKGNGYQDFRRLLERQRKKALSSGVKMSMDCTPVFRSHSPHGNAAVYVDEFQFLSILNGVTRTMDFRISLVFFKYEEGWRVNHLHLSSPSKSFSKKKNKPNKEIENLEKLIQQKTAELKEAKQLLKANQDQLVRQEKLASLGQLTAGIAHEIKNPLNFINNFSELSSEFLDEIGENIQKLENSEVTTEIRELLDDVKGNLEKISNHGKRADGIVKSMLLHSRGGSGKMEETDLNALLREYVNLSFHGMRANKHPINVEINIETDENLKSLQLNPENFSRVILNLCKNAFDAMRDKQEKLNDKNYIPRLTVRTKKHHEKVLLEIEDNGPGISEEVREKIMLPFFTTKKGSEGTGLGLSISQDIIKEHGGTMKIESEEGKFTRFLIALDPESPQEL